MEILKTVNLMKRFEGVIAVNKVSFSVNEGEIVGIIGPNGSGKTTLLNLITGLVELDEGEIYFKGEAIGALESHEIALMGMGRTFQITKLFRSLTVMENMVVPVVGLDKEKRFKIAKKWLSFLDLYNLKDELAGNLSGGQQKLLEIARVMMLNPTLLLMDEPFAGVHHSIVRKIVGVINQLREEGRTFLIVSHDMHTIFDLCDRMIVMNEGKKIAEGYPEDIRKNREIIRVYLGV
jgi:branched-chain amino acid transport system ATP-binding protein